VKRNSLILVAVAATVAVMLFAAVRIARKNGAVADVASEFRGQSAPDFELQSLDGKSVKLSDLRGKAVLLNFWATWCGPCKIEMPLFVELQKQYGPDGFQIVGVAMDDSSPEDIGKFVKEMGINYPILLGKEAVGQRYGGVGVLPTTFFIDRDGKFVAREFGLQSRSVFVEHIKTALSQGQAVRGSQRAPFWPAGVGVQAQK
jgi:thiol-disulfide isomerase/thioredoxin